ncbi:hypothetical protein ACI8B_20126 [Acinetobacter proteolyticus]|uniref:Uncharacterized protein n=1 Tax=Acinetobacter proteolyticus TaxID=1776741 RepID=A0A653K3B5_9GAMM|nr:hypothetical protein ACI8B_20126 [Acinetobacter proteolyticus]
MTIRSGRSLTIAEQSNPAEELVSGNQKQAPLAKTTATLNKTFGWFESYSLSSCH